MKKLITVALLLNSLIAASQDGLNIVPAPAAVTIGKGNFTLSATTALVVKNGADDKAADFLNNEIKKRFGFILKKAKKATTNFIQLNTLQSLLPGKEGAYTLTATAKTITINGQTTSGTFSGVQTLLQLINHKPQITNNKLSIPQLSISDEPRFAYRGMHLDVARHFFPVSFVKKYIDYLAAYKFNTFHWHLTDDQGWRIEIKKYPKLTSIGGWRNGTIIGRYPGKGNDGIYYGGFYTQEEIKDVVQYAADRNITVIPEIEMPGHASAAVAAYPQLSCFPDEDTKVPPGCTWSGSTKGKQVQQTWGVFEDVFAPTDYTFTFLQNVLDEVIQLFPSQYIHIGGDECPKEAWKRSAFCQQLIKDNNLKDEHGLQSYFINHIEKYLNSKGRNIIGWDEILEGGLAPNATVMSWRGESGGIEAAKQKHKVIMTPGKPVYFDHSQSKNEDSVTIGGYNSLEAVYAYEPVPKELNDEQAKYVLGAQANMWTEYMAYPSKVEYMLFPRMAALSEVLWTAKEKRNWKDFEKRLPVIFERLDKEKINYSKAYYDLKATVIPTEDFNGVLWKVETKKTGMRLVVSPPGIFIPQNGWSKDDSLKIAERVKKNGVAKFEYKEPIRITEFGTYAVDNFVSNIRVEQKFSFNKATGKKITLVTEPSKSYPGDGAFTLVNGVQNEKGLARSSEFLGFLGKDMDVLIDLRTEQEVNKISLHVLDQKGSWIYLPKEVEVVHLPNTDYMHEDVKKLPHEIIKVNADIQTGNNKIIIEGKYNCRYIRVIAKNYGIIPSGNPGAGNPAWLFVDEIEVE